MQLLSILEAERSAIRYIFNQTSPSPTIIQNDSFNPCDISGVGCNPDGYVTMINLTSANFTGRIDEIWL